MKDRADQNEYYAPVDGAPEVDEVNSKDIDGELWGIGDYKIPVIKYSPEEIFANKVPTLDVNFLNPSVKTGDSIDTERNTAYVLRNTISSWYVAIRTLAMVGLLSVLIYLGIRMVLSSAATDKAKYKQMLIDWIVALCLLFCLHYIMSFALTLCETVTSMIAGNTGSTVNVTVVGTDATRFSTNLIGLTRFFTQYKDTWLKLEYFILYMMMAAYTVWFTFTYLKRVLNMAFLTLIAPLVALTYPIDKVSDGKAQAFNIWLREFCFNALLQPFHLLIYIVLVSSALDLAVKNPLYAVVALGFIVPAEKLLRKMFGFDKASGGTVGTLAGAAGVAMATRAIGNIGKAGGKGSSGGKDKIRTKDANNTRTRDVDGNKKLEGFEANAGNMSEAEKARLAAGDDDNNNVPPPSDDNVPPPENEEPPQFDGQDELDKLGEELDQHDNNDIYTDPELAEKQARLQELEAQRKAWEAGNTEKDEDAIDEEDTEDVPPPPEPEKPKRNLKASAMKFGAGAGRVVGRTLYSGVKNGAKIAARTAMGVGLGAAGLAIGATSGDPSKAAALAGAGFTGGYAAGGRLIDSTVGRAGAAAERKLGIDGSIKSTYNRARYGGNIQAANAKADKEFKYSSEFADHLNFYYGNKSKSERQKIANSYMEYRKAGITNMENTRKALKLEEQGYTRAEAQNVVQMSEKNMISPKAWTDDNVYKKEQQRLEGMLGGNMDARTKKAVAKKILEGQRQFRNL